MKRAVLIVAFLLMGTLRTHAQDPAPCRLLCAPEFKIEPTVKFGNFFGSRIVRKLDPSPLSTPRDDRR